MKEGKTSLSHPHDLAVRGIFVSTDVFANLLQNYLDPQQAERLDLDYVVLESPVVVDENLAETVGDLRFLTRFKGTKELLRVFVFLEHQSKPQRYFAVRAIEYVCKAYHHYLSAPESEEGGKPKLLPYPIVVVLYHGKKPWGKIHSVGDLVTSVPGVDLDILRLPIHLIDLPRIPPGRLKGNAIVRALLDCLQSASSGTLGERYEEIVSGLKDMKKDPRTGSWIKILTKYAASQNRIKDGIAAVRRVYNLIYSEKEAEKMVLTTAEELRREGEARGRAEGMAKGMAKTVGNILAVRFGAIPAALEKKIHAIQDPDRFDELTRLAVSCASLGEFKKAL